MVISSSLPSENVLQEQKTKSLESLSVGRPKGARKYIVYVKADPKITSAGVCR